MGSKQLRENAQHSYFQRLRGVESQGRLVDYNSALPLILARAKEHSPSLGGGEHGRQGGEPEIHGVWPKRATKRCIARTLCST